MNSYIKDAVRTEAPVNEEMIKRISQDRTIRLLHSASGLCTESGEFMDALKRHIFYGKSIDEHNMMEELGDICWYLAIAMDVLGVTFDSVLESNIAKLKARFPRKFNETDAVKRDLDKEVKAMEEVKMSPLPLKAMEQIKLEQTWHKDRETSPSQIADLVKEVRAMKAVEMFPLPLLGNITAAEQAGRRVAEQVEQLVLGAIDSPEEELPVMETPSSSYVANFELLKDYNTLGPKEELPVRELLGFCRYCESGIYTDDKVECLPLWACPKCDVLHDKSQLVGI